MATAAKTAISVSSPRELSKRDNRPTGDAHNEDGGIRELTTSFITALHEDSEPAWQQLIKAVSSHVSVENTKLRRTRRQFVHYIHRVFRHVARNKEKLNHLSITRALEKAFPSLSTEALNSKHVPENLAPTSPRITPEEVAGPESLTAKYFPDDFFHYSHRILPKTFQGESIRIGHLLDASFAAEREVKQFEQVMNKEVTRPEEAVQVTLEVAVDSPRMMPLDAIYISSADLTANTQQKSMKHLLGPTAHLETELDVISTFSSGALDGKVDFVYLNYRTPPHVPGFDPYSLVVVSKVAVDPEHYVISRFGIVQVYPDGTKENFSFAEWCSHAITYRILKEIPVFRKFFMQKMIVKWKRNVQSELFRRRCDLLGRFTMRYFDDFDHSSIKVRHLVGESLTLSLFAPKQPGNYSVASFEEECSKSIAATKKPLMRLMKLCKQIMSDVESKKIAALDEVEAEVFNQPFVSDLPISKQKEKASRLAQRLATSKKHVELLRQFSLFIDRLVSSNLVRLVEKGTSQYVARLINGTRPEDDAVLESGTPQLPPLGLFDADLYIDSSKGTRKLSTSPPWGEVRSLLMECLNRVCELFLEVVQPASRYTQVQPNVDRSRTIPPPVSLSPYTASFKERLSTIQTQGMESACSTLTAGVGSRSVLHGDSLLKIPGESKGQSPPDCSPLDKDNFKLLLMYCEALTRNTQLLEGVLSDTEKELDVYMSQQSWLEDAYEHITTAAVLEFPPNTAVMLESTLSKLKLWRERMVNLAPHFVPRSKLVCVSCLNLKAFLDPALESVLDSVTDSVQEAMQSRCQTLAGQLDDFCYKLMARRYDLKGFLEYTKLVTTCESYCTATEPVVSELGGMLDVLSQHGIHNKVLKDDLQKLQEKWTIFCSRVDSEGAFVAKQTPSSTKALMNTIQTHEEDMDRYTQQLHGPPYNDPTESPACVLEQLKQLQEEVYSMSSFFQNVTAWKANILSDTPSSLEKLQALQEILNARMELWTSMEGYVPVLETVANTPVKKLNVDSVLAKVERVLQTASRLKDTLSEDDPALVFWIGKLRDLLSNLNLLKRLNSPAIKTYHWHSIFATMGVAYDRSHHFTLNTLLSYNISECLDNVLSICLKAEEEYRLGDTLAKMRSFWDAQNLQMDDMPSKPYSFAIDNPHTKKKPSAKKKTTKFMFDSKDSPSSISLLLYSVVDVEDMVVVLEDHIMSLQVLLGSSQLAKVSWQVSQLLELLEQIYEILSELSENQTKWMNLLKLFSGCEKKSLMTEDLSPLKRATKAIQEIMHDVYQDPRVMSLVRIQRGTRELQGASLRSALHDIRRDLDEQLRLIQDNMMQVRLEVPRLFFVSERDVLQCVTHRNNPLLLLPVIQVCFPQVTNMRVVEVYNKDIPGKDDGYHILSVEGPLRESLSLLTSLPLGCRAAKEWLAGLDRAIRVSLSSLLTQCVDDYPKEMRFTSEAVHTQSATVNILEWLKRYPHQCVVLAVEAAWALDLKSCVEPARSQRLVDLRTAIGSHLKALSSLMFQLPNKINDPVELRKMFVLMGKLLLLLQNKAASLSKLPESTADGMGSSFEYQSLPMYQISQLPLPRPASAKSRSSVNQFSDVEDSGSPKQPVTMSPSDCHLSLMGSLAAYGFEFQSLDSKVFLLPKTERCLVQLLCCLREEKVALLTSPQTVSNERGILSDLAQILGRPFYSFTLTDEVTLHTLHQIVLGTAGTGGVTDLGRVTERGGGLLDCVSQCMLDLSESCREQSYQVDSALSRHSTTSSVRRKSATSHHSRDGEGLSRASSAHTCVDWYSSLLPDCRKRELIKLKLFGEEMETHPTFLLSLDVISEHVLMKQIPQELKTVTRSFQWVPPDLAQFIHLHLLASGFQNIPTLTSKLVGLLTDLSPVVSLSPFTFIKRVVSESADHMLVLATSSQDQFYIHSDHKEQKALGRTITAHLKGRVPNLEVLTPIISKYFNEAEEHEEEDVFLQETFELKEVKGALEKELKNRHLQELPQLIDKCLDLHKALHSSRVVVLTGPGCSGKSTVCTLLAAAYRQLRTEGSGMGYPRVKMTTIHPAQHTVEELFGSEKHNSASYRGILPVLLTQVRGLSLTLSYFTHPDADAYVRAKYTEDEDKCSPFQHWIVLQGPLSSEVVVRICQIVRTGPTMLLNNEDHLVLPGSVRIIFETEELVEGLSSLVSTATASLVSFSTSTLPWTALVSTWIEEAKTKHNLNVTLREFLASLLEDAIPLLLPKCTNGVRCPCNDNQVVLCVLRMLSAMVHRGSPRTGIVSGGTGTLSRTGSSVSLDATQVDEGSDDESVRSFGLGSRQAYRRRSSAYSSSGTSERSYASSWSTELPSDLAGVRKMSVVFCYALIWSTYPIICGSDYQSAVEFDLFTRDILSQVDVMGNPVPEEGLVTDYYLDFRSFVFKPWREKCDGVRLKPGSLFTPVPELVKACHIAELLLSSGSCVVLMGQHGCGKTEAVINLIETKLPLTRIAVSAETSSSNIRNAVLEKYSKKQRSKGGALSKAQKSLFFLDDLHLATAWHNARNCPLETIYQASTEACLTDPSRPIQLGVHAIQFLVSISSSDIGCVSSKFLTQFVPVQIPELSTQSMSTIFKERVSQWLEMSMKTRMKEDLQSQLSEALTLATITVHVNAATRTLASLSAPVSLNSLMKVCEGLQLSTRDSGEINDANAAMTGTKSKKESKSQGTRQRRRSSLFKESVPKQGRLKDELARLARGRRKLKDSLEIDEDASRIVLLRNIVRLWCYECARVYGDHWMTPQDRNWISNLLNHTAKVSFCGPEALKELSARAEQSAVATARRRGKRPGRNLPVLPTTIPDHSDPSVDTFDNIKAMGYDVELLHSAYKEMRLPLLLACEQVCLRGEDLSQVLFAPVVKEEDPTMDCALTMFSPGPPPVPSTASLQHTSTTSLLDQPPLEPQPAFVYKECDDREAMSVVEEHIRCCSSEQDRVSPHRKLTEQVLKVCRILHMNCSHAIVFGPKGSGKKTVCRIAARLMKSQIVTIAAPTPPPPDVFMTSLKQACTQAAFEGRNTVLLIGGVLSQEQWDTVYLLMKEYDTLQGVFGSSELIHMTSRMQHKHHLSHKSDYPQHFKYTDTIEIVKNMIKKHLHVVICWSVDGSSSPALFPLLCGAAGYSMYVPRLSIDSCSEIALHYLETCTEASWRDGIGFAGGCAALAELVSHIHITTVKASELVAAKFVLTPRSLIACVEMGYNLSISLEEKEKLVLDEVESVLSSISEAHQEVHDMEAHLEAVKGDITRAQADTEARLEEISLHKNVYMDANQRCKEAENLIEAETSNVDRLTVKLSEVMDQVSQQYNMAVRLLGSVQKTDILELMSYNTPPEPLQAVLNALCVMFDRPVSWEDCQQLLLTKNFFKHLKFFDRDNVPKGKVKYLKKMIAGKRLDSACVVRGSKAALSISSWLKALAAYHSTREVMLPHEKELKRAKESLREAKRAYSMTKYKMEETREALEKKLQEHRNALHRLRVLEKHQDQLAKVHKQAMDMLLTIKPFHNDLLDRKDTATAKCISSPAVGLIVAAAALYISPLCPTQQRRLLDSWIHYCRGMIEPGEMRELPLQASNMDVTARIPIQERFSVASIFAEDDVMEKMLLYESKDMHVITERLILTKFLSASPSKLIPVVFDPNCYLVAQSPKGDTKKHSGGTEVTRRPSLHSEDNQRRRSSHVSFSSPTQILSLPGVSTDSSTIPPHIPGDHLSPQEVKELLFDLGLTVFSFSSPQAVHPEVVQVLREHLHATPAPEVTIVIFQDMDVCMRSKEEPPLVLQNALQQSSPLSCKNPCFTLVNLEMEPKDLTEYFRQKIITSLAPTFHGRHKAMIADTITHINSIKHAQLKLECSISSSQRMLAVREAIMELVDSNTSVAMLAKQRLEDVKSELAHYREEIEIFSVPSDHCCLFYSCARETFRLFTEFSLSLPQMEDILRKALKKINCVLLPLEPAGLAATVSEQVNQMAFPHIASNLSHHHYQVFIYIMCLKIWKKCGQVDASQAALLDKLILEDFAWYLDPGIVESRCPNMDAVGMMFHNISYLQKFPGFDIIIEVILSKRELWEEYFQKATSCVNSELPCGLSNLSPFHRLVLWTVLCPMKLSEAIMDCAIHTITPCVSSAYDNS